MYVRVKLHNELDLPNEFFYEVTESGDVAKMVEIEHDGTMFWDDVAAYDHPSEMIGINSLIEGEFPTKERWPNDNDYSYEEISREAFEECFQRAHESGKRRKHSEL